VGNSVDIIIRAVEKGVSQTFSRLGTSLNTVVRQINTGKLAMDAFNSTMKKAELTSGSMRSSLAGMVAVLGGGAAFTAAGRSAFAFNQTIEQSQIGIAALVRSFSDADMSESFVQATEIQKRLQLAGLKTTATYEQLLRALQEGVGPALRNGFDTKQIVSFTSAMTQAAAAISLPMDQLGQELRAIMDGTIDRNARIAKALGIENEDVKKWKEAGTLFEELDKKLKQFVVSGEQMAATFSGRLSNVRDAIQMALGQGTERTFAATTAALKRLQDAIVTIDEEAGTFKFNDRIVAAIDVIDRRISAFIKSISGEQMTDAMVNIVNIAGAVVDVFGQFSGAIVATINALGPLAPMLVKSIAYLTIFSAGWKVLSFAIGAPIAVLKALGAAFTVITGTSFIAWLGSLRAAMMAVQLGAVGMTGVFGAIYLAMDYAIKKVMELIRNYYELKELQGEIAVLQAKNAKANAALSQEFAGVSRSTGVAVTSMKELDAAVRAGKLRFDETVGAWVAGSATMGAASEASATKFKRVTGEALGEMKKKYQEYASEVKRVLGEIAAEEQSTYEQTRNMKRQAMTEPDAWADKLKQVQEYATVAKAAGETAKFALENGSSDKAKEFYTVSAEYYGKAKTLSAELGVAVSKDGKIVASEAENIKKAIEFIEKYSAGKIEALKGMNKVAGSEMNTLIEKSGFQNLSKDLDAVSAAWLKKWQDMEDGAIKNLDTVEERIETLMSKERTIYINVKEKPIGKFLGGFVERLASGGFPRLSGKLPGSDGPDGIRALLAPGEFIIRSAAVRKYGAALFHALNSMRFDVGSLIGGRISSAISKITVPNIEPVRMFAGGAVPAIGGAGDTYNNQSVTVNVSGAGGQTSAREIAKTVLNELQKMHRGRS